MPRKLPRPIVVPAAAVPVHSYASFVMASRFHVTVCFALLMRACIALLPFSTFSPCMGAGVRACTDVASGMCVLVASPCSARALHHVTHAVVPVPLQYLSNLLPPSNLDCNQAEVLETSFVQLLHCFCEGTS